MILHVECLGYNNLNVDCQSDCETMEHMFKIHARVSLRGTFKIHVFEYLIDEKEGTLKKK